MMHQQSFVTFGGPDLHHIAAILCNMYKGFNLGFVYEFYKLKSPPGKHFNRDMLVDVEI